MFLWWKIGILKDVIELHMMLDVGGKNMGKLCRITRLPPPTNHSVADQGLANHLTKQSDQDSDGVTVASAPWTALHTKAERQRPHVARYGGVHTPQGPVFLMNKQEDGA